MKQINFSPVFVTCSSCCSPQRQTVELVPLTQAHYAYSGKTYSFFVYGAENQVFMAKYPSACSVL